MHARCGEVHAGRLNNRCVRVQVQPRGVRAAAGKGKDPQTKVAKVAKARKAPEPEEPLEVRHLCEIAVDTPVTGFP